MKKVRLFKMHLNLGNQISIIQERNEHDSCTTKVSQMNRSKSTLLTLQSLKHDNCTWKILLKWWINLICYVKISLEIMDYFNLWKGFRTKDQNNVKLRKALLHVSNLSKNQIYEIENHKYQVKENRVSKVQ